MAKDSLETQLQVRHSCEQTANRIKDVKEWTKEMKAKDEKQKQKANGTQVSAQHFFFHFYFVLPHLYYYFI